LLGKLNSLRNINKDLEEKLDLPEKTQLPWGKLA
jgi:hypothetical protein